MKLLSLLFMLIGAVIAASVQRCVNLAATHSLHIEYSTCFEVTRTFTGQNIKRCILKSFIGLGIAVKQSNGRVLVLRDALSQYSDANNNQVATAARECSKNLDPRFYEEAARVVQCVYEYISAGCK